MFLLDTFCPLNRSLEGSLVNHIFQVRPCEPSRPSGQQLNVNVVPELYFGQVVLQYVLTPLVLWGWDWDFNVEPAWT